MRDASQSPATGTTAVVATPRSTLTVSIAALFALGVVNGAVGPLLPLLSLRVGAPVEALGVTFTALFLGALTLQLAGGWLNESIGLRRMVATGCVLLALAVLGISVSPTLPALLACALLAGAGQGALDASTNVLVPAVFGDRSVSAVNLLHFAFGAGAVLSPVMMSVAASAWGSPMPVLWVGAALGGLTALAASRWAMDPKVARHHQAGSAARPRLYTRSALWLLSLLLFLGVGVEMGTGGWTTVYAGETTTLAPAAIAMLTSGFWLALMSGRLLGAALGVRITSRRLAMLSIGTTCLGGAMLVVGSGSTAWTVVGTLVTGLGVGPIFPTTVVMATELFPSAQSRAVTVVIAVSSVGGMLMPPLQGFLLQRVAPLASVGLVAVACVLMMLLVVAVEAAAVRRSEPSRSSPGPQ